MFSSASTFVFSNEELSRRAEQFAQTYRSAKPFPHAVIDDFLPPRVADRALRVFPGPESECWLDWTKRDVIHQPRKPGIGHAARLEGLSPYLHGCCTPLTRSLF